MFGQRRANDSVHWYVEEQGSRVVAQSGRPSDRFHIGKLVLQGLKDDPDFLLQIDGATGESETSGSVLRRSVRCAEAFKKMGLKREDVIILMAPNHLDQCIPYYAALYLGVAIAPIDRTLRPKELQHLFEIDEPKIIFCQSEKVKDIRTALSNCKKEAMLVTFDTVADKNVDSVCFRDFLGNDGGANTDDFVPADFDPQETIAVLLSTSGSTGLPKQCMMSHKNLAIAFPYIWETELKFPQPTKLHMVISPLQWGSAIVNVHMSPLLRYTCLRSSKDIDQQHAYYLINTYKPTSMITSPTFLVTLLKPSRGKCDWTSFEHMLIGGSTVFKELVNSLKELAPNINYSIGYGMSEVGGSALKYNAGNVNHSCGKPPSQLQIRLIDVNTKKDIWEPNQPGELWVKGPTLMKGYYKNPEATRDAFSEDGWLKTGDLLYRDENLNFFYVERIKMLLKYKNHQVAPAEIQAVIRSDPGVLDVAVTGIPDYECGDLPVACVVKRPGSNVTAQEIKDLVKDNLTDSKQLRGGVIFLDGLPLTPSGKVENKKLKEIAIAADKEYHFEITA